MLTRHLFSVSICAILGACAAGEELPTTLSGGVGAASSQGGAGNAGPGGSGPGGSGGTGPGGAPAGGGPAGGTGAVGAMGGVGGGTGGKMVGGGAGPGGSGGTGGTVGGAGGSIGGTGGTTGGSGGMPSGGSGGASGGSGGASGGTGGTTGSCDHPNTCMDATDMGSISGDTTATAVPRSGSGNEWLKIYVTENNSGFAVPMSVKFTLSPPASDDYDLYIHDGDVNTHFCNALLSARTETGSDTETITWGESGLFGNGVDDSSWLTLEVRAKGNMCSSAQWTLTASNP